MNISVLYIDTFYEIIGLEDYAILLVIMTLRSIKEIHRTKWNTFCHTM